MPRLNAAFLRALDANGDAVSGAKMFAYFAGTSLPAKTFSNPMMNDGSLQAHPLISNSAGEFDTSYMSPGAYKVVVKDAEDVTLYEADNVRVFGVAASETITPADFGVTWDGSTDDTTAWKAWMAAAAGKKTIFPAGKTSIITEAIFPTGDNIVIECNGAELDYAGIPNDDGGPDNLGALFGFAGSEGTPVNIASISEGVSPFRQKTGIVRCGASHGLSVGDRPLLSSSDVVDAGYSASETRGQIVNVTRTEIVCLVLAGSVTVVAGETLTQAGSGATGKVMNDGALTDGIVFLSDPAGTFNLTGELSGSTSGALGANSVPDTVETDTSFEIGNILRHNLATNPIMTPHNYAENIELRGELRLKGPGRRPTKAGYIGLSLDYCRHFSHGPIVADGVDYQVVAYDQCCDGRAGHVHATFPNKGSNENVQYGSAPKNATCDIKFAGITQIGGKHAIAPTNNEARGGVGSNLHFGPIVVRGSWDAALAMHQSSWGCIVERLEAFDCRYGANLRAPGWRVEEIHAEDCYIVLNMTQDPRDINVGHVSWRRCGHGIRAQDPTWIGKHEARNIHIGSWEGDGTEQNAVHLDFSSIPVLTEADAAPRTSGHTTTRLVVAGFANELYNGDDMLRNSLLICDPDGAGSGVAIERQISRQTYDAATDTNTLEWVTPVGTAPNAAATYKIRSFVDDIHIGNSVSKNCVGADIFLKGPIRDISFGDTVVKSDSAQAQTCLLVQGTEDNRPDNISFASFAYKNKLAPAVVNYAGSVKVLGGPSFGTRAHLVEDRKQGWRYLNGTVVRADGYAYLEDAGTLIPDLPGLSAVHPEDVHWGFKGSYTLTNTDPWIHVLENKRTSDLVTLADVDFDAEGVRLRPKTILNLRAQTPKQARIIANLDFAHGTGITSDGVTFRPSDLNDTWLRANEAFLDFKNPDIDGSTFTGTGKFAHVVYSTLRMSTDGDVDSVISLGADAGPGWEIDGGDSKLLGNSGTGRLKFETSNGDEIMTVQQGNFLMHGAEFKQVAGSGATGINFRRGTNFTVQGDDAGENRFEGLKDGLRVGQMSRGHVAGTTFHNNDDHIYKLEGGDVRYDPRNVVFSGTGNVIDDDSPTTAKDVGSYRGLAPASFAFTSGAVTLAAGGTYYLGAGGHSTNFNHVRTPSPFAGKLKSLRVHASQAPGAGETFVVTIMDGGTPTGVTVTLGATDSQGADTVNDYNFALGNLLSVKVETSAGAAVAAFTVTFVIEPKEF